MGEPRAPAAAGRHRGRVAAARRDCAGAVSAWAPGMRWAPSADTHRARTTAYKRWPRGDQGPQPLGAQALSGSLL